MIDNVKQIWTDAFKTVLDDNQRGASSIEYTQKIFANLNDFFHRYNITSMFDAGCNDAAWINNLNLAVKYQGGDISSSIIRSNKNHNLNLIEHDIRQDPIPPCDLLWIRDVMIHLKDQDRQCILKNWLTSNIPWIMMTQCDGSINQDIVYDNKIQCSETNWYAAPWNFPKGVDYIWEMCDVNLMGRKMELWHRDQIYHLACIEHDFRTQQ